MRIFFDTEFTQFREGELLSIGLVSEDNRECVAEVHDPDRHARASAFCHSEVLPQFGTVQAHVAKDDAGVGEVIYNWLASFEEPLTLCYDYKLDWRFFEEALRSAGAWNTIASNLTAFNVADVANSESCLQAQEQYFLGRSSPGRHHPLVDALALRERWREYVRLGRPSSAA